MQQSFRLSVNILNWYTIAAGPEKKFFSLARTQSRSCNVGAKKLEPKDRSVYKCVFLFNLRSSLPVTTQKHNGSPYLDLLLYHYNLGLSMVMSGIEHPEDGLLTKYLLRGCIKG